MAYFQPMIKTISCGWRDFGLYFQLLLFPFLSAKKVFTLTVSYLLLDFSFLFLHLVFSSTSRPSLYFWRSFGSCHEQRPPLAAVPLSFSRAPGAPTCLYSCPSPPHLSTPIFQPACPILGNLLTPTPACAAGLFGPRLCSVSGLWFSGLWVSGLWLWPRGVFHWSPIGHPDSGDTGWQKCGQCYYLEHSELNMSAHTINIIHKYHSN